ncbi:MAG TPA: serine/threonine-protein kinase [Polyangiaceae bacterium]|nr:serine/threonine-protein kinase [Polyangiaceae bacterium]
MPPAADTRIQVPNTGSDSPEAEKWVVPRVTGADSASLEASTGGPRFLQKRLLLICKTIALIDVVYYALFALALSLDSKDDFFTLLTQSFSLETLGEYGLLTLIAVGARLCPNSIGALRALDAGLLLGLGTLWSSWCFIHPYPALGAYEMVLALVAAPLLRAVLVPSSGVRTFLLTAGACVPGLIASFVAPRMRHLTMMTPATLGILVLNWCSLGTAFSTVASTVIYGLRREVKRARRLGQYTLLGKLGQGGMGVVYLARHALLRRRTVVKLLSGSTSPLALDRFEREVQITSQLTHPNTIAVYDFGRTEDGLFYYAMEHLEGSDLEALVAATGPCPPARVIHILRQACGALEEAHARGLLHRDIKPSNLFLCPRRGPSDVVKVLDFGLVKQLNDPAQSRGASRAGSLVGTPLYMSPEQIAGSSELDARSDLYALGAVGYFLLTGAPLFDGKTTIEVCCQHLHAAPLLPSARLGQALPADLEFVIMKCLEKNPKARYANAREMRSALFACQNADAWREDDALAWWAEHERALDAARITLERDERPATIAVDWSQRRGSDAQPSFRRPFASLTKENCEPPPTSTVPEGA